MQRETEFRVVCRKQRGEEYKSVVIFDDDETVSPLAASGLAVSFVKLT